MDLKVRALETKDVDLITQYWINSTDEHLVGMGVDLEKLPDEEGFKSMLYTQIKLEDSKKQSLALIWEVDGRSIGHSNVNKIVFGEEAYMHLHIWNKADRKLGLGYDLIKLSIAYFFKALNLNRIYCEPYAFNPSPNRTLEKAGFTFVKQYKTTPGSINFEQEVNRWVMTKEKFVQLD